MEWKEYKLSDILAEKGYIRGPFGSALKRADMLEEGIPVYEQQNAIYNHRKFRYFISKEKHDEMKRFTVQTNDLIISCSGTVGEVSIISENDEKGIISQALLLLRTNPSLITPEFLYYFFKTPKGHNSIIERSTGSVQVNIAKRNVIEQIPILLPNIRFQDKIVSILSSLDSKIETNNKINAKLEEMAQALFKSWFVDFEPFKDKGMVESELGMIPEGWRVGSLTEIATYTNGLAMQKFPPEDINDSYPVLKIKELGQGCCDSSSDRCSKNIREDVIVDDGDVIFSWSGTLLVDLWCGGECGLNQHLFKVTSNEYPKWFYLYWTKHHLEEFIRIAKDKAVTMGHIKRGHLESALVAIPNENDMKRINDILVPIVDKIVAIRVENRNLSQLRDTLLPKLMSGEIEL